MVGEATTSLCPVHGQAATGICTRCGRFGCGSCLRSEGGALLCAECLARPDVRLTPSPRAKRVVWFALLGLHGVLILLPVAAWQARSELLAISGGESPPAGRPYAQGGLWLALAAMVLWAGLAIAWFAA